MSIVIENSNVCRCVCVWRCVSFEWMIISLYIFWKLSLSLSSHYILLPVTECSSNPPLSWKRGLLFDCCEEGTFGALEVRSHTWKQLDLCYLWLFCNGRQPWLFGICSREFCTTLHTVSYMQTFEQIKCDFQYRQNRIKNFSRAHENGCAWNSETTRLASLAALAGNLECLKYVHEEGCDWTSETCAWPVLLKRDIWIA